MGKKYTKSTIRQNCLRGGGCASSNHNQVHQSIKQVQNQNLFDLFQKLSHYVKIIESKASVAANLQESQEIMIAIQWFVMKEENIYQLNKCEEGVQKSYDLIIDGIIRLLRSCLIYIRTDSFKCFYILQITTSLSKVIFSFHLMNEQRYMKCDTKKSIIEICQELKQQIEVERNDLIQNQIELYLQLTQVPFEIAPTDNTERDEILKGCLKGIIMSVVSMSPEIEFFEQLFNGACLLFQRLDIPKKRKQFEAFYQIDMLQWEVINYFKDDKEKTLEEIILRIEKIYEALIKNSRNWHFHYMWIQMIGKILSYNPLVTKRSLGRLYSTISIEKNSCSQIWKDYQNKGLLIQTNYDNDEAVILLNQLQNKKKIQFDRLILESIFKRWKSFLLLKEYLMNEQQENISYTFGYYLKGQLQQENEVNDKYIQSLKQIQKFLGFIISNNLINLIQQSYENLEQVDEIMREFANDKPVNIKISQSTYTQKLKRIISNLEEYFYNHQKIFKLFSLNQKKNLCGLEQFQNNQFIIFQQFKYQLIYFEYLLQESLKESKAQKNELEQEKYEILLKQKLLLKQTMQTFSQQKDQLQFIDQLQKMLNTLTPVKEKNFVQKSQRIIKLIQDTQKQVKIYEIQLFQNDCLIKYFQDFIQYLYLFYEQKNQELQKDQTHLILSIKQIFISQYEIDAVLKPEDLEQVKNNIYKKKLILNIQTTRSNLLQLKLQLVSLKEAFYILLKSMKSEKLQQLEEVINFDDFLLNTIKNYPQKMISFNNKRQINFKVDEGFSEVTEKELKNKLSKQKGSIQFLLFQFNLEQQEIDSEKKDLELIESEFGELFVEQFSSFQIMKKIGDLLEQVPIDKSLKHVSGEIFDESQLKLEKEIYENFLFELLKIKVPQSMQQIKEVIISTQILVEIFQNSANSSVQIFLIPIDQGLKNLNNKIQEFYQYKQQQEKENIQIEQKDSENTKQREKQDQRIEKIKVIQADEQNCVQQNLQNKENGLLNETNVRSNDLITNQQNFQNNKITLNEKCITGLLFLIKVVKFKNARIIKIKQLLEQLFGKFEQVANVSDFIFKQPQNIQQEMLNSFNSIITNLRIDFESLLWIQFDLQQWENENFQLYYERMLTIFYQFSDYPNNIEKNASNNSENQAQYKTNIYDFVNKLTNVIQKQLSKANHFSNEFLIEQNIIIMQLQKIYLSDKEDEKLDEDVHQDFGLFDSWIQSWHDFKNNDEWKIKQGLVFTIIQISSNCFTNSIQSFCQNTLIKLWVYEKDQRVRNLLQNQGLIGIQMQILQRDWKNQHDRIEAELQLMLKKIDDLQEQVSQQANLNKRDQQLIELDETTQQLEEYISSISEMGQQLKLITGFVSYLRKGLKRVEIKINDMKEQINNIGNDIKLLRGKSVEQLFEIRKWKVLKWAAQKNVKSIYVPLKTLEKKQEQEEIKSNLMNLEKLNDKEGEVNEFLLDGKQTVLLIHGTAGSGKSTTAKKIEEFIWELHGKNQTSQMLIPIYISLPSLKNPIYQAVEETLRQDEYGFDDLQLKECKEMLEQEKFRFLLIMDSYDEMKMENIQKNLYISNKLYQNWSNPLVIFTTRSEIFSSTNYTEWFAPEVNKNLLKIKSWNIFKNLLI